MPSRGAFKGLFYHPTGSSLIVALLLLFMYHVIPLDGEVIRGEENEDFDFDGMPGSTHEFKVMVTGSEEQCFHQPVRDGSSFFVYYNVLKGGDKKIDFYVRQVDGKVLEQQTSQTGGYYRLDETSRDVLTVCVDNVYSRFGAKLIHVSLISVIPSLWDQYNEEIREMNLITTNFTRSLSSVQLSIAAMMQSQTSARFTVMGDWYQVNKNAYYISVWSMAQCVLIVTAAMAQVFILRRLFRTTAVTPTSKPRA